MVKANHKCIRGALEHITNKVDDKAKALLSIRVEPRKIKLSSLAVS